jgi:hypothetical protein
MQGRFFICANRLVKVIYPDQRFHRYLYENGQNPNVLTGVVDGKGKRFATFSDNTSGYNGVKKDSLILMGLCLGSGCHGQTLIDLYNPDPYQSTGGLASTPAPYTHTQETNAMNLIPDPFGSNCPQMKVAIKILEAQINWRKTDLNPDSFSYLGHKKRIQILQNALNKLKKAYQDICAVKCK